MENVWSWGTFALYIGIMLYFYYTTKRLCKSVASSGSGNSQIERPETFIRKKSIILYSFIPVIIAAFRRIESSGLGGSDMYYYIQRFQSSTSFSFRDLRFFLSRDNPLFYYLMYVIRFFTDNEKIFFFIVYFIIVLAQYYFFREVYDSKESFAPFFFLMYYFLRSFSIMKFMLGVSILGIAFVKCSKGKKISAIIISLIASLIHSSLIFGTFMLVVYVLFEKMAEHRKWLVAMVILFYLFLFFFRQYLYIFFSNTEFNTYVNFETSLMSHFTTILCGCLTLICYKNLTRIGVNQFLLFAVIFDLACIPIQNAIGFFRLHYIFFLPRLYMWGKLIDVFKMKIRPRQVEFLSSVAFIAWTIFRFMQEYEGATLMPYVFDLFK